MAARDTPTDPLEKYWSKRDFSVTSEPRGERQPGKSKALSFVIQKHAASRLHYDFRLELDGVLGVDAARIQRLEVAQID